MNRQINRSTLRFVLVSLVLAAVSMTGYAHPEKGKSAPVTVKKVAAKKVYNCPMCLDKFTEAEAKKANLKCSCCKAKLVRLPEAKSSPKSKKGEV